MRMRKEKSCISGNNNDRATEAFQMVTVLTHTHEHMHNAHIVIVACTMCLSMQALYINLYELPVQRHRKEIRLKRIVSVSACVCVCVSACVWRSKERLRLNWAGKWKLSHKKLRTNITNGLNTQTTDYECLMHITTDSRVHCCWLFSALLLWFRKRFSVSAFSLCRLPLFLFYLFLILSPLPMLWPCRVILALLVLPTLPCSGCRWRWCYCSRSCVFVVFFLCLVLSPFTA